jgi:transcriptional regulator with XRE-family HTH domain
MRERTLGEIIRETRVDQKRGLRDLARSLAITPSYLSDIEYDRRIPSEDVLQKIADLLGLKFDDLMALAGRFGDDAERHLRRYPEVGRLFRRITEQGLHGDPIRDLIRRIDEDLDDEEKR